MRKLKSVIPLACLIFCTCTQGVELTHLWSVEGKFNMPESAAYDAKRQAVYVSNVNQYAKDNNGFISRVSADGKQLDLQWLTGLHSPTGLTVHQDTLYAVDYDALVVIDLNAQRILFRADAPDASEKPVLNDVTVSPDGRVFVSGSRSQKIYELKQRRLEVWLHDPKRLKTANGLLVHQGVLFHGGWSFTAFDLDTRQPIDDLSAMGEGMVDIDGITVDGQGGLVISLIDDARLWSLKKDRAPQPLVEDGLQGIDMHHQADEWLLFLPRVGNTLSVYRLKH